MSSNKRLCSEPRCYEYTDGSKTICDTCWNGRMANTTPSITIEDYMAGYEDAERLYAEADANVNKALEERTKAAHLVNDAKKEVLKHLDSGEAIGGKTHIIAKPIGAIGGYSFRLKK